MHPLFLPMTGLALGLTGAATISIYTVVNRRAREQGARRAWGLGAILGAAGMSAMGAGWWLLSSLGPHIGGAWMKAPGWALCALAALIYAASARWVGRWRSPSRYSLGLFTGGIYRHVRHPQALALCILAVGLGLGTGSVPYLLTVPLWIGFWTAYTYLEERNELIPVFGEEYLRYRKTTPRILPRISSIFR